MVCLHSVNRIISWGGNIVRGMANNSVNETDKQTVKLIELWGNHQTLRFHEARLAWSTVGTVWWQLGHSILHFSLVSHPPLLHKNMWAGSLFLLSIIPSGCWQLLILTNNCQSGAVKTLISTTIDDHRIPLQREAKSRVVDCGKHRGEDLCICYLAPSPTCTGQIMKFCTITKIMRSLRSMRAVDRKLKCNLDWS